MKRKPSKEPSSKLEKARSKITDAGAPLDWLKILVYGKPKKGKTTFGATGPKPIIIDCNEQGTLALKKFDDVKIFQLETWTDIDYAYWYLHHGDHDRETVVIDTVTSLASLCMKFVLGDEASRDPTKDPLMPSKREWGKVGELMKTQIIQFRNLPMNVVFLAQERRGYTEDEDDTPEVVPDVSPTVRNALTPAVDIIGRIYTKEVTVKGADKKKHSTVKHQLLIGDHEIYTTGNRAGWAGLPKVIGLREEPDNLVRIIDAIKNPKGA